MPSAIVRTARDRLTVRHVLPMIAVLVLLYAITRSVDTLVLVTIPLVLAETLQVLRDTPTVDDRWIQLGTGAFIAVVSLAWLSHELTAGAAAGGPAWFPALTALIGVWFLLDARNPAVTDRTPSPDADEDMSANEVMLVLNHVHLVAEELKSDPEPKTVAELADACDLTDSRVHEALDLMTDDGTVYRVDRGSADAARYELDEAKVGGVAFVRSNGKRIVRRLARPFRR
ncbi:hypothetical protein [Natrialba taiwanensis]|uniref:Uncharacterized protein n=1 Tax=Natrialba taiwanensis DSM 12281 TaxID=1230458 RepID=M0A6W8_9EURY|nr:hypothetical protein [Natrialba taiwanensis]ELY94101.1 hypothetical protein C484_06744 [Natrialba taiwanensis DSM 12281]